MTTAARPTFDTARGGSGQRERDLSALSKQYSSRDLPSHTSLKTRDRGQSAQDDLKERDLKRELHERERAAARDRKHDKMVAQDRRGNAIPIEAVSSAPSASSSGPSSAKRAKGEANLDADDPVEDSEEDDDSDDDSDDDDAMLMAELQKIKEEKAAEEAEKEDERRAEEEKIRMENILTGNPLLKDKYAASSGDSKTGDMRVKRRWDDDVVFKNCSRAAPEREEKQFINDSIRSDFHKKFMDKYIK